MSTRIILPKPEESKKKRTAAYCRVSSSSEEQLRSYAAQTQFYTEMLSADKSCEFVGVYADEGITGTSAKKRPQFMAMIEDCRAGKIDAIITKSVSRFGRNTVDTLSYTRELKALGIDVYFEKENLHSISPEGELLLTLMAAFAESEAETMSENIAWGFRKRYAEGNTDSLPMHNVYGFDRDTVTGEIFIRPDEAAVVRRIYDQFMKGVNTQQISNRLNEDGVPTHRKGAKWHNKTVINILQNEKYCGDVLFQKTFSPGAQCHCKQNRGELPQYLVRDAIPAIIDKKQWEITQLEYARRVKQFYGQPSPEQPFTGRIFCGVCGRTVEHSAFRSGGSFKTWWRCSTKVTRMTKPDDIPHEDSRIALERPAQMFVKAWNLISSNSFRTVLWTGSHLQLTLMSINVGEDIGLENHSNLDQFIRIERGQGLVMMGSSRDNLSSQRRVFDGYAIIIPAGTWHNLINMGNEPLKLYSIYAPPQHPKGTVHKTKADSVAAE